MQINQIKKINASAGSGKTYTLTNAFVDLLFNSDLAPCESCKPYKNGEIKKFNFSELLAITFTNLAANQMKEKVLEILKEYAFKKIPCQSQAEQEEKAKKAHAMLDTIFRHYGSLNIRTIDSLLNQIIGLFALELGYAPKFETAFSSDILARKIYEELAEKAIYDEEYSKFYEELCETIVSETGHSSFLASDSLRASILNYVNFCIVNDKAFSSEIVEKQIKQQEFLNQEFERLEKEIQTTTQQLEDTIKKDAIAVGAYFAKALVKVANGDYSSSTLYKESFLDVVNKASKGYEGGAIALYSTLQKNIIESGKVGILRKEVLRSLPFIALTVIITKELLLREEQEQCMNTQKMPHIIANILGVSEKINDTLRLYKQQQSLVSAAYCRLGTRLKHILYDEFQDTSTAQWNALKDLSSEALSGGGSVLFVGDVKQAIYGWRGGDAKLFDNAPNELSQNGFSLQFDNLACNWRSSEHIIGWNNMFFGLLCKDITEAQFMLTLNKSAEEIALQEGNSLVQEAVLSLQNDYAHICQEIDKSRLKKVQNKGTVQVHYLNQTEKDCRFSVLCLLPEMVKNLHKRYKYGDICILTTNNAQASRVAQVLLAHEIPVVSQGSLGLKEHPLLVELMAFLQFLVNPLNDNAFCTVLLGRYLLPESFYERMPLANITEFLAQKRQGSCHTAFKEEFPSLWDTYFKVMVDGAGVLTAYDTLCEVYERLQLLTRYKESDVYLTRLQEIAYLAEEHGVVDIESFCAWWEENGENEKAPLPEGLDSVSVMTMHKSKGLEFEAVIIPWHNFLCEPTSNIQEINIPYNGKNITLYSEMKKAFGTPYLQNVLDKAKENINTHYVAWTRAKNELHVFMPSVLEQTRGASEYYRFVQAMLDEVKEKNSPLLQVYSDYWHYGQELSEPVLSDNSLRALEYLFLDDAKKAIFAVDKEKIENLSKTVKEKLNTILEEAENLVGLDISDYTYYAIKVSRALAQAVPSEKSSENSGQVEKVDFVPKQEKELMGWLPELKIFRTDLDELRGIKDLSGNKRGTLIHKALEYLVFSDNLAESALRATKMAMKFLPYARFEQDNAKTNLSELEKEIHEKVQWFAELDSPYGGAKLWFDYGYREHAITNAKGELFRVDLLVQIPEELKKTYGIGFLAIDYKTGYKGQELPVASNKEQMENYIKLLVEATGENVRGLLVYLDCAEFCEI